MHASPATKSHLGRWCLIRKLSTSWWTILTPKTTSSSRPNWSLETYTVCVSQLQIVLMWSHKVCTLIKTWWLLRDKLRPASYLIFRGHLSLKAKLADPCGILREPNKIYSLSIPRSGLSKVKTISPLNRFGRRRRESESRTSSKTTHAKKQFTKTDACLHPMDSF